MKRVVGTIERPEGPLTNNILTHLCTTIPQRFDPGSRGTLRPSTFYYLLYLVDAEAGQKGAAVNAPWYWWYDGPKCDLEFLPQGTFEIRHSKKVDSSLDDGGRIYPVDESPPRLPKKTKQILDEIVDNYRLIPEDRIKNKVIESIRMPFLDDISNFATDISKLNSSRFAHGDGREGLLYLLDNMVYSFPNDGFEKIEGQFARLEPVLRLIIKNDLSYLQHNLNIVNNFHRMVVTNAALEFHGAGLPALRIVKLKHSFQGMISRFDSYFHPIEHHVFIHLHHVRGERSGLTKRMMQLSCIMRRDE